MAALKTEKPLVIPARGEHTATVFLLHGLGEIPQDIDGIYKYCRDKKNSNLQHIKWVLPYAPLRPITKDHGMMKRGWFDVIISHKDRRDPNKHFPVDPNDPYEGEDGPGLLETVRYIDELIEDECTSGIPEHRIVLAGHSQGAVVSILAGLTGKKTRDSGQDGWNLAGVMPVSGYIPIKKVFAKSVSLHARDIPVFWGHGKDDRVIFVDACIQGTEDLAGKYFSSGSSPIPLYKLMHARNKWENKEGEELPTDPRGEDGGWIERHVYEGYGHMPPQPVNELEHIYEWLERVLPR